MKPDLLEVLRSANPAPSDVEIPDDIGSREIAARLDVASRHRLSHRPLWHRSHRVWAVAGAAAVAVVLLGLAAMLNLPRSDMAGRGDSVTAGRPVDQAAPASAPTTLPDARVAAGPDMGGLEDRLVAGIGGGDIDQAMNAWSATPEVGEFEPGMLMPWAAEDAWQQSREDWTGDGVIGERDRLAWMLGGLAAQLTTVDLECGPIEEGAVVRCGADVASVFLNADLGRDVPLVFALDESQRILSVSVESQSADPMEPARLAEYLVWLSDSYTDLGDVLAPSGRLRVTSQTVPLHRRLVAEWAAVRDVSLSTDPEAVLQAFYLAMQAGDVDGALGRLDPDIDQYLTAAEWRNMLEFRAAFWPQPSPLVLGDCGYLGFGTLYRCEVAMAGPLTDLLTTTSQVIVADIREGRIVSFDEQELLFSVAASFGDRAAASDPDGYGAACLTTRTEATRVLGPISYNRPCGEFLATYAESQGLLGG
jgi:hypothetical protein